MLRIFIGRFDDTSKNTWIYQKAYYDRSNTEVYITSFYFTVTTVLTVGYGDISAFSLTEMVYCIFLMVMGVLSFSFATGTLSSIIQSYDSKEAAMKEKIATLMQLNNDYKFGKPLYRDLLRTIKYDHKK